MATVLPDDGHRLRERRSAHRARVREDRRRRDRAVSSHARRRRVFSHRPRRARTEGRAGRGRSRRFAAGSSSTSIAARFEAMWRAVVDLVRSASCGRRATSHKRGVRALIERIHERTPDDFYEKCYEGWYCVGCELFKRDDEIVDGKCVLHPTRELQWTTERNWFFRLTKYEDVPREPVRRASGLSRAGDAAQRDPRRCSTRASRTSRSRGRSLSWAIPFPLPLSTGETQGTWVWFDALPNYLTATGFPDEGYRRPLAGAAARHRQGHHAAARGDLAGDAAGRRRSRCRSRCGRTASCCFGGERFSKSAGVRLDLDEAIDRFGADALRYFLLREVPFDADGSFSCERFDERYNRRPRQRARQPGEPRDLDGREVLRQRRARGCARRASTAPTPPISPSITRRWTAVAGSCCTRGSSA